MLKRDYLQKQLEELSKVLRKMIGDLTGIRSEGNIDDAITFAKESLTKHFELDMENLIALSMDDFKRIVVEANTSNPVQLNYLAELLFTTGELMKEKGDFGKTKELFSRSLMIYEHLNKTERTYSAERQEKINTIRKEIKYEPE
jgi:hypothetical protein